MANWFETTAVPSAQPAAGDTSELPWVGDEAPGRLPPAPEQTYTGPWPTQPLPLPGFTADPPTGPPPVPPADGPPAMPPPASPPPGRAGGGGGRRALRTGVVSAVVGVLAGGGFVYAAQSTRHDSKTPAAAGQPAGSATVPTVQPSTGGGTAAGLDVKGILAKVEPAVVSITDTQSTFRGRGEAAGTGMIISASGDVLTNAHVVAGGSNIQVTIPGKGTHPATLVGADTADDVAVVHVTGVSGLPTVTLASSKTVAVGDPVVAIGNALALSGTPTVTTGIVSALDRQIQADNESLSHLIQHSAPINPGNSGGPLLNAAGEVIGMNTATAGSAQSIGFAIPTDQITTLLPAVQKGGNTSNATPQTNAGFLGVQTTDADPGAGITDVVSGSPADQAGLQQGDVIVGVDGTQVADAQALVDAVGAHKAGDKVRLQVQRNGQDGTVTVTLGQRPTTTG